MDIYAKGVKSHVRNLIPDVLFKHLVQTIYKSSKAWDKHIPNFIKYRGCAALSKKNIEFPELSKANIDKTFGPKAYLLAYGGDLSVERLVRAVEKGILPFNTEGEPLLWWVAHERVVVELDSLKIDRATKNALKRHEFDVTVNTVFDEVLEGCRDTHTDCCWLTDERIKAFQDLNAAGYSHSMEVWQNGELVGGLLGFAKGRYFLIESKYCNVKTASKYAFAAMGIRLKEMGYKFCDVGHWPTNHLTRLGCQTIGRTRFMAMLEEEIAQECPVEDWGKLYEGWDSEVAFNEYKKMTGKKT